MKTAIKKLILIPAILNLASCSCAIRQSCLAAQSGGPITRTSFHAAAQDLGFQPDPSDSLSYHKRSVKVTYSADQQILLHSSFCPTPITLLTGAADFRTWETRWKALESSWLHWYAQRETPLKQVNPTPPDDQP